MNSQIVNSCLSCISVLEIISLQESFKICVCKSVRRISKTLLKIQTPSQLRTAAISLQLRVPWTTIEMSTVFSTRKMRRGAARSSSSAVPQITAQRSSSRSSQSAVPQTNAQRSTSRSSQSAVPQTIARTSTLSAEQQQLREVADCLPM